VATLRTQTDDQTRPQQDHFAFLIFLLAGIAAIIGLKAYFSVRPILAPVIPIVLMLVYMMIVTRMPRFRLREDQAGDNLYYMGFLYTLTSLAVALYHFAEEARALEYIIASFSVALATTILGVALRVYVHQMRQDPADTEWHARMSLAASAAKLRAELDESVQHLNSFTRQLTQSLEEAFHRSAKGTTELLASAGETIAAAVDSAKSGIEEALARHAEQTKAMNAATRRHVQATEKLTERVELIDPIQLIEAKLAPAAEAVLKLTADAERQGAASEARLTELTRATQALARVAEALERGVQAMRETVDLSTRIGPAATALAAHLEQINAGLNAAVNALLTTCERQSNLMAEHEQAMRSRSAAVLAGYDALAGQLTEVAATVAARSDQQVAELLGSFKNLMNGLSQTHAQLTAQANASITVLAQSREAAELEVARSRSAAQTVITHLVDMVQTLEQELGKSADPN
jgi:hypothetical protein